MNFNTIDCRTIKHWTKGFEKLYCLIDRKRSPEEFWNAAMAHISGIGEAIRRVHYRELLYSAAHAFCWMTCYVRKCNETEDKLFNFENNFSEIVGLKYPKVCGHCIKEKCNCDPVDIDLMKNKAVKYKKLLHKGKKIPLNTYTLSDWLLLFYKIYSGQIHLSTLESIGFHLLEEAGEEAKAVRQLVQFRGIIEAHINGIDENYLRKISNIQSLVDEYYISMEKIKKIYKTESEKEARSKIDLKSTNPDIIKARLVMGKMDFVIELADTFSWFCSVLLKLWKTIEEEDLEEKILKEFHIEEAMKKFYQSSDKAKPLICYACKETFCKCLFFPKLDN